MKKKLLLLGSLSSTVCLANDMGGVFVGIGQAFALLFFGALLVAFAIALLNGWILFRLFLKDAGYSLERSSWVQFLIMPTTLFFLACLIRRDPVIVIVYTCLQMLVSVLVYWLFFPRISKKNILLMALITGPLNDLIIGALFFLFMR